MNLMTANASDLIAASAEDWRRGMGKTVEAMTMNFRRLAKRWHPDRCVDPRSGEVFARLQAARRAWKTASDPKIQVFHTTRGTRLEMRHVKVFPHELGETYIGHHTLMTAHPLDVADLAARASQAPTLWSFRTAAMRAQIAPSLPHAVTVHTTPDRVVHVSSRDPALIRLADLTANLGRLDPHHVAWIGSGLWNLACYLEHINVVHQAINQENVWVDPVNHRVAILGGWAYAGIIGSPWTALPGSTLHWTPQAMRDQKVHLAALDHILIRALLRELLGDPSGMLGSSNTPKALTTFARLPVSGSAVAQYAAWKQALETSFGKPRFVELNIPPSLIYPEN